MTACVAMDFSHLPVTVRNTTRRISQTCEHTGCTEHAAKLCDWRNGTRTCDALVCATHVTTPAPGKDLCAKHAGEWELWKRIHSDGRVT